MPVSLKTHRVKVMCRKLEDVAREIDIGSPYLSKIERKLQRPGYWLIPKIAKAYGLTIEVIQQSIKPEPTQAATSDKRS